MAQCSPQACQTLMQQLVTSYGLNVSTPTFVKGTPRVRWSSGRMILWCASMRSQSICSNVSNAGFPRFRRGSISLNWSWWWATGEVWISSFEQRMSSHSIIGSSLRWAFLSIASTAVPVALLPSLISLPWHEVSWYLMVSQTLKASNSSDLARVWFYWPSISVHAKTCRLGFDSE